MPKANILGNPSRQLIWQQSTLSLSSNYKMRIMSTGRKIVKSSCGSDEKQKRWSATGDAL